MSPSEPHVTPRHSGPWDASGSLLAGVAVYGFLGWLVDRWLGTSYVVAIGVLLGAALGTYLMLHRLKRQETTDQQDGQQS